MGTSDVMILSEVVIVPALKDIIPAPFECQSYNPEWTNHLHLAICYDSTQWRLEKYDEDFLIPEVDLGIWGHRPAIHAKLCRVDGDCMFQILGIHLAAGRNTEKRSQQIEVIQQELNKQDNPLPTIIAGDWNSYNSFQNKLDEDDIDIFERILSDSPLEFASVTRDIPSFKNGKWARVYDHIVVSSQLKKIESRGYEACRPNPDLSNSFLMALAIVFLGSESSLAGDQLAENESYYYGATEADKTGFSLKQKLHDILDGYHISQTGRPDKMVASCDLKSQDTCYRHLNLGYKTARRLLFGSLHLDGSSKSSYSVTTYYCLSEINNDQLPKSKSLGPMKIPSSQIVNTEHSWPQSKFSSKFPKGIQKADLHALFPVRHHVNSTRGSVPYGIVETIRKQPCEESALGYNKNNELVFEPSEASKGDVARATFYFAVRYKKTIDATQEAVLRQWHELDPVTPEELERNEQIFQSQHVRNPFVDHPEWVAQINDF